jgi:hypothetical protein
MLISSGLNGLTGSTAAYKYAKGDSVEAAP